MKLCKFFNWHVFDNNCQIFIKDLLITSGLYHKRKIKDFVCQNKFQEKLKFSDLTVHIIYFIINTKNFFETYKDMLYSILKFKSL